MDVRRLVRDSGQAAREIVLYDTFLERPEATRAKVAGFAGDGMASGLAGDAEHPVNPALKHHKLESLSAPEDVDLREAVDPAASAASRPWCFRDGPVSFPGHGWRPGAALVMASRVVRGPGLGDVSGAGLVGRHAAGGSRGLVDLRGTRHAVVGGFPGDFRRDDRKATERDGGAWRL